MKKTYCILQYILIALIGVYLMMNTATLAISEQISIALFVVAASVNVAWIMENRNIAIWLEWPKSFLLTLGLYYLGILPESHIMLIPIIASASLLAFVHLQHNAVKQSESSDGRFDAKPEL